MSTITVTRAERLDELAGRVYGSPDGHVEAILDDNPGLAGEGLILTPGRVLVLHEVTAAVPTVEVVRLWT